MSDSAPSKAFGGRLYDSAKAFLKGLPAVLATLVAGALVIILFAAVLPEVARFNASIESSQKSLVIDVRDPDLPVKCIRASTLFEAALLGAFTRQRVVDKDGTHYVVHEMIKREDGKLYPCRDRALDAAYVETLPLPAATADKN